MFSTSGASGEGPVGAGVAAGHPLRPHRATYGASPEQSTHYQQLQGHPQGYPAQQYAHQQPRAASGLQPGGPPGGPPPPGSLQHGAGGLPQGYSNEQYAQGYGAGQPQGPAGGVPHGYTASSPHMLPRNPPPPSQQHQQGLRYAHQPQPQQQQQQQRHLHVQTPGQASYVAHAPTPSRSPASLPVQQPYHFSASPTTYAPPHPLLSPLPPPGPSPRMHSQRAPSTSNSLPPQQAHAYGQPVSASQPGPGPPRPTQQFSPHPAAPPPHPYGQQVRRTSYTHAAPPPHPRQNQAPAPAAAPPPAHATTTTLQAQAQAQAPAQAQLATQAHAERARQTRAQFAHLEAQRDSDAAARGYEREEAEVVPASMPLPMTGSGYVAAPVQQHHPVQYTMQQPRPPSRMSAVQERPMLARIELAAETEQRTQFHAYLLDYLQKAGFLSTAAALLVDAPSIPTHPHSSGRSFAIPSSSSSSQPLSAISATFPPLGQQSNSPFFTSPSALSPLALAPAPPRGEHDSPRRRAEGSPVSPLSSQGGDAADNKNNADTVASTTSTASTVSHFGFDALDGGDGEGASPAKDTPRSPSKRSATVNTASRNVSASSSLAAERRIPAANVQIDSPTGFLFEWWAVFWDVFRAQAASRGPGAAENVANARSFRQASSAAVDAAMQRQASFARGAAGAQPQPLQALSQPQGYARQPPPPAHQTQQVPPMSVPVKAVSPAATGPPGPAARQPIPLRTTPLGSQPTPLPQVPPQRVASGSVPSRATVRRGAIPPEALPDEALPPPGPATEVRRASTTTRAAHLALQRRQEQQAEINVRMAQARVHAQQITHRQRSQGLSPGMGTGTPEGMGPGAGMSPPVQAIGSPNKAGATPPVSSFSPTGLHYHPGQLQQAAEARNAYRARLVASQQSQLEQAKRAASTGPQRPSAAPEDEGSMPPPAPGRRGTHSLQNTPKSKELALGASPSAELEAATPGAEANAAAAAGPGKRRRESLAGSASESREAKKRATHSTDGPSPAASVTPAPHGLPEVNKDSALVSSRDLAVDPGQSSATPGAPQLSAPQAPTGDFIVDGHDPSYGASGFGATALGFDPGLLPDGSGAHLSLEELDALLSSTVNAAGSGYPPEDAPVGDAASFNYDEFMNSFGNDGPASYDPTVQVFDLAV